MSAEAYAAAIAAVDPLAPKYLRRDVTGDGKPETFCNTFIVDCCLALGVVVPWLLANDLITWLLDDAKDWVCVDAVDAMHAANRGAPTLATWANADGPGHLAMVVPSTDSAEVQIAQAGYRNYLRAPLATGFGSRPVRFFTHHKES